jgi:TRAP-type transport system small permease protein
MRVLAGLARALGGLNAALLALGRGMGIACVAAMVIIILLQVFFRYVLGDALAWPDEAARFLMLWMTGLMAPTAFRRGGFVAIDLGQRMMPRRVSALLSLVLLAVSLGVLVVGFRIGWAEVTGFGGRFDLSAMKVPTAWDLGTWRKVPRAWMMASLSTGVTLLILVNIELILRSAITLLGGGARLAPIAGAELLGAE